MTGPENELFPGFSRAQLTVDGTTINTVQGGAGASVLLLHGYPQTHVIWHRVAPALVERFTVVCSDLRGYGDSGKPRSDESHEPYSKRAMAEDQLELMRALGFERFALVGHDRGARVARRLALDYPDAVSRLAILDIVPTETIYGLLDQERTTTVWRYFFLVQPPDLPERLIGANSDFYLNWTLREWSGTSSAFDEAAVSEYQRCFDAATIHAGCEDYRAGATIDLAHDRADEKPIHSPLLVLWSAQGIGSSYDVLSTWQQQADAVQGRALDCGHFLPEERSAETAANSPASWSSAELTETPPPTPAAVLVPLFRDEDGDLRLVLVVRGPLGRHGHQLSLPGVKHEPGDASLLDTALRAWGAQLRSRCKSRGRARRPGLCTARAACARRTFRHPRRASVFTAARPTRGMDDSQSSARASSSFSLFDESSRSVRDYGRVRPGERKTPVRLAGRWRSSLRTAAPIRRQNPFRGTSWKRSRSHPRSRPKLTSPAVTSTRSDCRTSSTSRPIAMRDRGAWCCSQASMQRCSRSGGQPNGPSTRAAKRAPSVTYGSRLGVNRPASCSQQAHSSSSRSNTRSPASRSAIANWRRQWRSIGPCDPAAARSASSAARAAGVADSASAFTTASLATRRNDLWGAKLIHSAGSARFAGRTEC
jgi:haloacetate dehalogenase